MKRMHSVFHCPFCESEFESHKLYLKHLSETHSKMKVCTMSQTESKMNIISPIQSPRNFGGNRSNTSLLIKVDASKNNTLNLVQKFHKFGKVAQVVSPFNGNPRAAIITFSKAEEANAAFENYKDLIDMQIYDEQESNSASTSKRKDGAHEENGPEAKQRRKMHLETGSIEKCSKSSSGQPIDRTDCLLKLKLENDGLKKKVKQWSDRLKEKDASIDKVEQQNKKLCQETKHLSNRLKEKNASISKLTRENTDLVAKIERQKNRLKEKEEIQATENEMRVKKCADIVDEARRLFNRLKEKSGMLETLEQQNIQLKDELKRYADRLQEKEAALIEMKQVMANLMR